MISTKNETKKKIGWTESIVEKTGYSQKDIDQFLKKYNIRQSPNTGTPKRVNFLKITFSGTKKGEFTNDFNFEFASLSAGIWGLFSDKNGRGKTTILEIVKWLFRGKPSAQLQLGVKSWLRDAVLTFVIDDKTYTISIQQNESMLTGQIKYFKSDSKVSVLSEFLGEAEMAEVVSDFWLNELGLNQIASFRQSNSEVLTGKEVEHGWPALASALFIGTDYSALFGDTVMSGLPTRIFNMFLGLPWISTHASLKALEGQLKSSASVEHAYEDRDKENRRQRLADIQKELQAKKGTLASKPVPQFNTEDYNALLQRYNKDYVTEKTLYREWIDEEEKYEIVNKEWLIDKKKLTNFLEDKAANLVFKRLNPTCCPHCEQKITPERLEKEKNEHKCAICDTDMIQADDTDTMLMELQEAERASAAMCESLKNSVKSKRLRHTTVTQSIADLKAEISKYEENLQKVRGVQKELDELKREILRLEILEEEYKTEKTVDNLKLRESTEKKESTNTVDENKILKAAQKITEDRFKDLQAELLQDVNRRILSFCKKVGLDQYQSVTLTSNPHLKIEKDGSSTSYSNVSSGEQLRLKVIVTIALISVAEERGLGRHPGFLVIDSPAAQEVNPEDLDNLINGLEDLCKILPSLQIIIASVASPTLLKHVDEEHRLYATGQDYLW